MKLTASQLREFATFFVMQLFIYAMVTFSFRAVAQAAYITSVLIDVVYASATFWVFRKIAKTEETTVSWIGYTCGSASGTALGIWISILVLGK